MTDQAHAPIPISLADAAWYFEHVGRAALDLGTRPKFKFAVVDGDRRRFSERTSGRADLKIIRGKEQP